MLYHLIIFILLKVINPIAEGDYPSYPQDYFAAPMDIEMYLSGTFGEIRSAHFHSGIDIKTRQVEGLPVFASADGYIARIKISPYGFGKALYVQHPNGYLTVYAHLQKFAPEVEEYVRNQQYKNKSFSIELYPGPDQFKFKKGEKIAYSGNSGGSGGPHLHFEIRDGRTQKPINPLLFGFDIKDNINPALGKLAVYNKDDLNKPLSILPLVKNNDAYSISGGKYSSRAARIGLGITAFDQSDGSYNKNGVYRIKLYDNDRLLYHFEVEKFAFSETRYVLAHIDYREKKSNNHTLQRCYLLDGNLHSAYKFVREQGYIDLSDNEMHEICIEVDDALGNNSVVKFSAIHPKQEAIERSEENCSKYFPFDRYNTYHTSDFKIDIPSGALFKDLAFNYSKTESKAPDVYSDYHQVHQNVEASFKYFTIAIKTKNLDPKLQNKALIVSSSNGSILDDEDGTYQDGWVKTRVRNFGEYFVTIDVTPPEIRSLSVREGQQLKGNQLKFYIDDNLSGIDSYNAYVDGEWILLEYDPKKKLLIHDLQETTGSGKHNLKLVVIDDRNNKSELNLSFII
ncbi:MAG: M23 family metallopeptidase [Chitinophagales bacterium]|nr:M23 family metallopeptidase [Chitinophagales bacterium]